MVRVPSGTLLTVHGVPQGSVLGPPLFILYVNDIPDIVDSKIKMFANDIKINATITTVVLGKHLFFTTTWTSYLIGKSEWLL